MQFRKLKRRELITLLGGAAAMCALAARAQQSAMQVIGVLWPGTSPPGYPRMESFTQALRQLGFTEGQNVSIELRYARGGLQQVVELAAELVRLKVDVIATFGDLTPKIAQQATRTIPIIAISDDILGAGLVESLSRPGANTTGLTISTNGKNMWKPEACCRMALALRQCGGRPERLLSESSKVRSLPTFQSNNQPNLSLR